MEANHENWRTRFFRWVFNFWPCIRGSGARVTFFSADYRRLRVKIPLNWRTRNRVGTIFGGSMYSATDPFFMIQLMQLLGNEYVVWDKAAAIRFKRPGREALFVEFYVSPAQVIDIRQQVEVSGEISFVWTVQLCDRNGVVHAEVDKTLYVASKAFYREKLARRSDPLPQAS